MSNFTIEMANGTVYDASQFTDTWNEGDSHPPYRSYFCDPDGTALHSHAIYETENKRGLMGWRESGWKRMTEEEQISFLSHIVETGQVGCILNVSSTAGSHLEKPLIDYFKVLLVSHKAFMESID